VSIVNGNINYNQKILTAKRKLKREHRKTMKNEIGKKSETNIKTKNSTINGVYF